jgi:hypothetical protein
MRNRIALVLIALATSACHQTSASVDPLTTFDLRPGEVVTVEANKLVVTFKQVSQDSRCPDGVQCVWAGDATVHLDANPGQANAASADLHTNTQGGPAQATLNGYTVQLVALSPYPKNGQQIQPGDYVATLRVTH